MNKLAQDQILKDITKLAIDYINEEKITDPTAIDHVMNGIRIGIARGIEIARSVK